MQAGINDTVRKRDWESNIYSENESLNQIMVFDLRFSIIQVKDVGDKLHKKVFN